MPWGRFPGARVILGPEMKSTGEVMGIAPTVPAAYAKTQFAIDYAMPEGGLAFVSVNDGDKRAIVSLIRDVERMGFGIVATQGTAKVLRASGIDCLEVSKIHEADAADGEGERPSALDLDSRWEDLGSSSTRPSAPPRAPMAMRFEVQPCATASAIQPRLLVRRR